MRGPPGRTGAPGGTPSPTPRAGTAGPGGRHARRRPGGGETAMGGAGVSGARVVDDEERRARGRDGWSCSGSSISRICRCLCSKRASTAPGGRGDVAARRSKRGRRESGRHRRHGLRRLAQRCCPDRCWSRLFGCWSVLATVSSRRWRRWVSPRWMRSRGNCADRDAVRAAMTGCDAVLHCANVYTWSPRHQASLVRTNTAATEHVLQGAVDQGLDRVVHVSSYVALLPSDAPLSTSSPVGTFTRGYAASAVSERAGVRRPSGAAVVGDGGRLRTSGRWAPWGSNPQPAD